MIYYLLLPKRYANIKGILIKINRSVIWLVLGKFVDAFTQNNQ